MSFYLEEGNKGNEGNNLFIGVFRTDSRVYVLDARMCERLLRMLLISFGDTSQEITFLNNAKF